MELPIRKEVTQVNYKDMSEEELMHYGIKGQKWGRRQYQNKDGSLTEAGKKRYGSKENFEKQYPEDVKRNVKNTKKAVGAAEKAATAKQQNRERAKEEKKREIKADREKQIREEAYKMSDKELRDVVNRLNMEERYTQVMRDREVIEVGKSKTEKFMDFTVTALTVASTGLSIYATLKGIKD